ncbi:FimV family protein [Curvibacter sp. CHRR-16]|uniref:FimV/HubP family polar landmark protein n=1 Tax=Curvibacter sp. CHRR-16 TaxID=2835872 RepID=UPI001BDAF261|nr:FimV/HubP family polar landmark protein [Curvibacter sp. CHRR-16]MBT0571636.1 FimV family protein [Curvibacter sp. CHRR-16]
MSPRWQKSAVAIATFMVLGLPNAHALSLGRLTVLSGLGEPLRAEIDIAELSPEEAETLKVGPASPNAFVAAGMEYNPAMTNLQVSLQRKADGKPYLRLSSDKMVNEPFVDLLLETTWASGRIVRDYVMLFDPPHLRANAAPTLAQATTAAPPATSSAGAAKDNGKPNNSTANASATARANTNSKPATAKSPTASDTPPVNSKSAPASSGDAVTVKNGDTAIKIAERTKADGVSLDQMLVALLQTNPNAFVASNLNRLRSGAVLNIPSSETAQSVSPAEARKIVVAHSKDFDSYRQGVAAKASEVATESAGREASGTIKSQIEDKKSNTTPDKLTLSKGSVQTQAADKIAKEKESKQLNERNSELNKNIEELNKISAAAGTSAPAKAPAPPTPAPAPAVTASPAPAPAEPPPAPAAPPAPVTPEAAPTPPKVVAPPPPPPAEEPSLVDTLLEDPLIPAAGAGLLALIGGYIAFRIRQKKKSEQGNDSSFLESRLQPDSFFGSTGGQKIDTNQEAAASSMVYSPSQLDAADDVDPVAEADVYLAYGRDLQAEEILKEAAQTQPGRIAVYTKLMDIYAKRKDVQSLEATARELLKYTGQQGDDWAHACKLGLSVDPNNPLYQTTDVDTIDIDVPPALDADEGFSSTKGNTGSAPLSSVDLDLDLDFSPETAAKSSAAPSNQVEFTMDAPDILLDEPEEPSPASNDSKSTSPIELPSTFMDLDMAGMSLDLNSAPAPLASAPDSVSDNPLETKLALADEFMSIGDEDGARALIEEVLAEASGDMRSKAQQALANLK